MVTTPYDEYRDELRQTLKQALSFVCQKLMDPEIWGYEQMSEDYAIELYKAVRKVRDAV